MNKKQNKNEMNTVNKVATPEKVAAPEKVVPEVKTESKVKKNTYSRKQYFLYAPGKGLALKSDKGVPKFGCDGELMTFTDMRQVNFVCDLFVKQLGVVDTLDVLTKVG